MFKLVNHIVCGFLALILLLKGVEIYAAPVISRMSIEIALQPHILRQGNGLVCEEGSIAVFIIRIYELVLGQKRLVDVPDKFLKATFPDCLKTVKLSHVKTGVYLFKTPVLNTIGRHTLEVLILNPQIANNNIFIRNDILAQSSLSIRVIPRIIRDNIPPQNPSAVIEEGESVTNRSIHLLLHADGANQIIVSENINFTGANWEPYVQRKQFVLSSNLGRKNVFVKFRDLAGDETGVVGVSVKFVKLQSQGVVKVQARQLLVNNAPYVIKGVVYQPVSIGLSANDASTDQIYTGEICDRDFTLLRDMGCNTIRTYRMVTEQLLDKAEEYGIKVCAGFWIDYNLDLTDNNVRNILIADFQNYVSVFRNHPAVLMWVLGNEQNINNGNITEWYSLANQLAQTAYDIEGINYHPAAIVNGGINNIGNINMSADDDSMPAIDIWGINIYAGYSFINNPSYPNFFNQYMRLSLKPLWISEYGIDAWDNINNVESQKRQASWDSHNWDEIAEQNICIGATLMSYSDEWWKMRQRNVHDNRGFSTDNMVYPDCTPDRFFNEEWWGIVSVSDNGGNLDIVSPRLSYYAFKKRWAERLSPIIVDDFNDGVDPNLLGSQFFTFDSLQSVNDFCSYEYGVIDNRQCLSISYSAIDRDSWAGFVTSLNNLDLREYDILEFCVKGSQGREMCKIGLKDSLNNEAKINLSEYLPEGVNNVWQRVRIPLSTFGNEIEISLVANMSISFENQIGSDSGTIYIDDLCFNVENQNNLSPIILTNFDSTADNTQSALGYEFSVIQEGNSQLEYNFISNTGENNTPCIQISYNVGDVGICKLVSTLSEIDVSQYNKLFLNARGFQGGESFSVYLEDKWHNRGYAEVSNINLDWQNLEISLGSFVFQGVDVTCLTNLEIVFETANQSGVIYLDNIEFI